MTIHQFLNGVIYAGTVTGALAAIGVFVHFAAVRPLRHVLRSEIVSNLVEIRDNLRALETRLHDHIEYDVHPSKRN